MFIKVIFVIRGFPGGKNSRIQETGITKGDLTRPVFPILQKVAFGYLDGVPALQIGAECTGGCTTVRPSGPLKTSIQFYLLGVRNSSWVRQT
jgi:hypothetical protein